MFVVLGTTEWSCADGSGERARSARACVRVQRAVRCARGRCLQAEEETPARAGAGRGCFLGSRWFCAKITSANHPRRAPWEEGGLSFARPPPPLVTLGLGTWGEEGSEKEHRGRRFSPQYRVCSLGLNLAITALQQSPRNRRARERASGSSSLFLLVEPLHSRAGSPIPRPLLQPPCCTVGRYPDYGSQRRFGNEAGERVEERKTD